MARRRRFPGCSGSSGQPDEPGRIRTNPDNPRRSTAGGHSIEGGRRLAPRGRVDWSGLLDIEDPDRVPTISEYGREWLARRRARGVVSVRDDASRFELWIEEPLGELLLSELTARLVSRWLVRVTESDLAPRTVRRVYQVLAGVMQSAALDGLIPSSPCYHGAQLPPDVDADPERLARAPLTASECSRLMSDEVPPPRRVLWSTAILTGARIGELGGLEWGDIDRSRRPLAAIRIVRQLDSRTGELRATKTRIPRLVPVHRRLSFELRRWREGYAAIAGVLASGSSPLLVNERGRRWTAYAAKKALERDCERLGISRHTPHNLRTTFVTLCRNARRPPPRDLVRKITHTSRADVLDLYTVTSYAAICRVVGGIEIPERGSVVGLHGGRND